MTTTPRSALIHELANAVEADATLSSVDVYRGFPENLNFALPAVSITANLVDFSKRRRHVYRETDLGGGTCEVLFETERREYVASLELWAQSKTDREPLELAIDDLFESTPGALSTDEPRGPALELVLSEYYDAKVRALLTGKDVQDDGGARDGYFRLIYTITVSVPKLVRTTYSGATFETTTEVEVEPFFGEGFD